MHSIIYETFAGLIIPFLGTTFGAAAVFFMKREISRRTTKILNGLAAGVMTAASVWSLLIPAIDESAFMGELNFLPAAVGFWLGVIFITLLEYSPFKSGYNGEKSLLSLAVTLHNIPEGLAVGIIYAGVLFDKSEVSLTGALALSLGIAIQNIPEGAIISMPLYACGKGKNRSFARGVLSGIVEPFSGFAAVLAASLILPAMPYLLSFAAGAMICVVIGEMIPEVHEHGKSISGTLSFSLGFTVMMCLDVALG